MWDYVSSEWFLKYQVCAKHYGILKENTVLFLHPLCILACLQNTRPPAAAITISSISLKPGPFAFSVRLGPSSRFPYTNCHPKEIIQEMEFGAEVACGASELMRLP